MVSNKRSISFELSIYLKELIVKPFIPYLYPFYDFLGVAAATWTPLASSIGSVPSYSGLASSDPASAT